MQRRRGQQLEDALLDAAWAELTENGYASFTIDAVAQRAGTSRPVLYRRWSDRIALVEAAVAHAGARARAEVPDTGSLRGDLLEIARLANETRVGFAVMISVMLAGYFAETGRNLADLRELMLAGREHTLDTVMRRAAERGEIDEAKLTPRIAQLPFDLFRHQMLMTLRPVPLADMEEIIDTIFLPLVR